MISILKHGEKIHTSFSIEARGTTSLGEALWCILQNMVTLKENRKILFIVTDGEADNTDLAIEALNVIKSFGIEVYGIGIETSRILKILPHDSRVITHVDELLSALFEMVQRMRL